MPKELTPTFTVISKACDGDETAISKILEFYDPYINQCCMRPFYDDNNNLRLAVVPKGTLNATDNITAKIFLLIDYTSCISLNIFLIILFFFCNINHKTSPRPTIILPIHPVYTVLIGYSPVFSPGSLSGQPTSLILSLYVL